METLLITGGASGIGEATARRMAGRMRVVIADLDGVRAESVAKEIGRAGGECLGVEVDVADAASVGRMAARLEKEAGAIHALFNNAGTSSNCGIETIDENAWNRTIRTHVKGTFLCAQIILKQMCARNAGTIVNMSSDYAVKGMRNGGAYAAAKTAIYSLTKSLAAEFASYGIRVNAVGPGPIETPLLRGGMTDEAWRTHKVARARLVPMGRLGQPSEVASVVDFLLSDRSSYVTGQIIHPNGGQISW
jgi:NAD(P)-dependent dehydrogenase (short-subunit alcohol dehydrogenase family)